MEQKPGLITATAEIVAAYLSRNEMRVSEIPAFMKLVHDALVGLSPGGFAAQNSGLVPAVPVHQSVMPDYIVCLEDGKKMKMLKRYLKTAYGMTPGLYREKWGLPADYPMVAPNYAKKRSLLARAHGLGTRN